MPQVEQSQHQDAISFGPFSLFPAGRLLLNHGQPVQLGSRAFDILLALAERAGQVVSKNELIDLVWRGVNVDEGALRFHIASLRKSLGDGEGSRYLVTLQGRGYCFVAPIARSSGRAGSTSEGAAIRPHRLPLRLSRMIGRQEAVQKLAARVLDGRLVTVVGPGGIGKTTVAVATGHLLSTDFDNAVLFLDLGSLGDPLLVPSSVASTLGLPVQSEDPTPAIVAHLREKRVLLILDSCEHVVEAAATLADRIFRGAPQTHILATSREVLRVDGEHVHPLESLDSPPDEPELSAAQVLGFSAVELFIERVAASGYPFELSDRDAPILAEMCRRLDGIPLAIELAAGRVSAYGIRETAARLNDRLTLSWQGRRTALPRHQTLGATLDWSYDLLPDMERSVLCRLSIFVGVFTLEAARAVAAGPHIAEDQFVAAVAGLVMKSLVATDTSMARTRYRLLDTTRAYALGKLRESGETDRTAHRHATYFLGALERTDVDAPSAQDRKALSGFGEYLGNVRAALQWSLQERGDIRAGVALAAASAHLFLQLSLLTECCCWSERAITLLSETDRGTPLEMELQAALGHSSMFARGNSEQAEQALKRGLILANQLGDLTNELRLLARLHIFHERAGDFRTALAYATRGLAVATEVADPVGIVEAHSALGISRFHEGDTASARYHFEVALVEFSASKRLDSFHFGSLDYRNRTRIMLARVLWLQGLSGRATTLARDTIEDSRAVDHPVTLCMILLCGALVFIDSGDLENADLCLARLIDLADQHSLAAYRAICRGLKGKLLIRQAAPESGVALLRGALEILRGLRYEWATAIFETAIAEGLAMMGRFDDAAREIDEAVTTVKRNGNLFTLPELLRVQGSIWMSRPQPDLSRAETCFLASLDLAGRQGALAWELRTATNLALLQMRQGSYDAGRILAPICDRFANDPDNADLAAARRLLNDLS
ncbi:ATP-binding protein [Bradyrhizobium cenepequi]